MDEGDSEDRSATPGDGAGPFDALAASIVADAVKADPALAARAAEVLSEQSRLMREQAALVRLRADRLREEATTLEEEQRLALSHQRVRRIGDYARVALETLIALMILAVLIGLGTMVVGATRDRDLVFDETMVPPDMAARGVTGKVVSRWLLDAFARFQTGTSTISQDAESFRSGSGGNIRIAIPNTGISVGDLNQYLRDWLGNETHVSADIVHTADGVAMTVRFGQEPGATFSGPEKDISQVVQRAAEALYARALPLRYADYLAQAGRYPQALAILEPMSQYGTTQQRAGALTSWAELLLDQGDIRGCLDLAQTATSLAPNSLFAQWTLADCYGGLGREEDEHRVIGTVIRLAREQSGSISPDAAHGWLLYRGFDDQALGDYQGANLALAKLAAVAPVNASYDSLVMLNEIIADALDHDLRAARAGAKALPDSTWTYPPGFGSLWAAVWIDAVSEDWNAVAADGARAVAVVRGQPQFYLAMSGGTASILPVLATALAHQGKFVAAEAILIRLPLDCDPCVRARGRVAALRHDWAAADHWFAIVAARSPSMPQADNDWGQAPLARGDFDGAIAKFVLAHEKSPRFADPLELWGEALMAKNRSDLAVAKFAEANRTAPNWGRLHLKWGEALEYTGHAAEARIQYGIASGLDLTAAERTELSKRLGHA